MAVASERTIAGERWEDIIRRIDPWADLLWSGRYVCLASFGEDDEGFPDLRSFDPEGEPIGAFDDLGSALSECQTHDEMEAEDDADRAREAAAGGPFVVPETEADGYRDGPFDLMRMGDGTVRVVPLVHAQLFNIN